jgi:hypothetical protein
LLSQSLSLGDPVFTSPISRTVTSSFTSEARRSGWTLAAQDLSLPPLTEELMSSVTLAISLRSHTMLQRLRNGPCSFAHGKQNARACSQVLGDFVTRENEAPFQTYSFSSQECDLLLFQAQLLENPTISNSLPFASPSRTFTLRLWAPLEDCCVRQLKFCSET